MNPSMRSAFGATMLSAITAGLLGILGCGGSQDIPIQLVYGFVRSFSDRGSEAQGLQSPVAFQVIGDGVNIHEVWVGEAGAQRISRYDFGGVYRKSFSLVNGTEPSVPVGMAQGSDSLIYVALQKTAGDTTVGGAVAVFDTTGAGVRSSPTDPNFRAVGIAASRGLVYVCEKSEHFYKPHSKIEIFNESGSLIGSLHLPLDHSHYDTLDNTDFSSVAAADSSIWVCDRNSKKIYEFRADGRLISSFGTEGAGNGQWAYPGAIAVTDDRHLLVADPGNSRVEEFKSDGTYVTKFGAAQVGNPASFKIGALTAYGSSFNGEYVYLSDPTSNTVFIVLRIYVRGSAKPSYLLRPRT